MANQAHLDLLKQGGVEVWNQWRDEHRDICPDLSEANLSHADLREADLSEADLTNADLFSATLSGADLTHANLNNADLYYADLTNADLFNANLLGANLSHADLTDADLSKAYLGEANLSKTNLNRTDFNEAEVGLTVFADVDLSVVKNLETAKHGGPSTIGIDTIILSHGKIPEIFLRDAGIPSSIIEQIPALIGSLSPIDFYSCFISYSSKDQAFAERLRTDLKDNGVRCWFAPHDLPPGTVILKGIDEAIREYDKVLLILSRHSVASNWVEHEVDIALFKEMQKKHQDVLFPIRLDNIILKSPSEWAKNLCHRQIADFTKWKQHDDYQQAVNCLLRHLKVEAEQAN